MKALELLARALEAQANELRMCVSAATPGNVMNMHDTARLLENLTEIERCASLFYETGRLEASDFVLKLPAASPEHWPPEGEG